MTVVKSIRLNSLVLSDQTPLVSNICGSLSRADAPRPATAFSYQKHSATSKTLNLRMRRKSDSERAGCRALQTVGNKQGISGIIGKRKGPCTYDV